MSGWNAISIEFLSPVTHDNLPIRNNQGILSKLLDQTMVWWQVPLLWEEPWCMGSHISTTSQDLTLSCVQSFIWKFKIPNRSIIVDRALQARPAHQALVANSNTCRKPSARPRKKQKSWLKRATSGRSSCHYRRGRIKIALFSPLVGNRFFKNQIICQDFKT